MALVIKTIFYFFLLISLTSVFCDKKDNEIFVPTKEWKEIREGQKIPAGLHVRINLQTGKKEAKLPDESSNKRQALVISEEQNEESIQSQIPFAELEETLKKIKNDENQDSAKNLRTKFRSYEELKKELDSLELRPKFDSEIIRDLVKAYKAEMIESKNNTIIKNILVDLEYLSHQLDNALEFVSLNGFREVVYTSMNNSNAEIKSMSLRLLSSLMQNNPKVQIHGLTTGCIGELLKLLSLDKSIEVKYLAVGALSSVLRRFPLAQNRFMQNGGLSVISKVFEENNTKMNVKLITLVTDLVSEHQLSVSNEDNEATKQYELLNLEEKLVELHWCENLNKLLHVLVATDEDNYDFIEKCLKSMNIFVKHCGTSYDVKVLNYLYQKYNRLAIEDIDEDEEYSLSSYYSELKDLCDALIKNNKIRQKTEL